MNTTKAISAAIRSYAKQLVAVELVNGEAMATVTSISDDLCGLANAIEHRSAEGWARRHRLPALAEFEHDGCGA